MLYSISNLECAYSDGTPVLSVPELNIESGKILVVLGKSGYGKSTLLETLALMNHTISKGTIKFSPPSSEKKLTYNLEDVWKSDDKYLPSRIRSAHFSFIFQNTNLMPNFTIYENVYITKMIQGFPETDCRKETLRILDRIGLSSIEANRKVTSLSGGQRQRVAFARAIISSFDVLFGDEPTGNLDEANAYDLLTILSDFIHDPGNNHPQSAILVTHSVELAMMVADLIIVIDKNNGPGFIKKDSAFTKHSKNGRNIWIKGSLTLCEEEYKKYLKKHFFTH